jgi:hypothetical protein
MVAYCPHQLSPPLLATKKDFSIYDNMSAGRGDGGGEAPLRILEKKIKVEKKKEI